jgi:putative hydrolase of the HAD superfamily
MIKVILFDLGGVLVELTGVPVMLEWTNHRYDEEALWEAWLNSPVVRSFEKGCSTAEQFADGLIKEMDLPVDRAEFIHRFREWPKGLFPGVPDLLEGLRDRYTLACLSNSNGLHWPILMNDMGLEKMFRYRFASHLMKKLKPDRASFEYVLHHLGCRASSVLFLDDNAINVKSAREMGMFAYRVAGPQEIEQALGKAGIFLHENLSESRSETVPANSVNHPLERANKRS